MPNDSNILKSVGIGCGIVVVCAFSGMLIGVIWAVQYEKRTGIDGGNAPAFFLIIGGLVGILAAVICAFSLNRRAP